jgi:maltose alpha-D-glucosyltransferase/alpha-amylase
VAALSRETPPVPPQSPPLIGTCDDCSGDFLELVGVYAESARQLGRRTAEMHRALVGTSTAFAPEPFGKLYQRSLYQGLRNSLGKLIRTLEAKRRTLPAEAVEPVAEFLRLGPDVLERFGRIRNETLGGQRIRIHGDYHLARLLHTGKDFIVSDFEGDPGRTLDDRRIKRSPLRDVSTMICSLDYAVQVARLGLASRRGRAQGMIRDEDLSTSGPWAEAWYHRIAREFTQAYLTAADTRLLPQTESETRELLEFLLLEHRLQEAASELETGAENLAIPIRGLLRQLKPVQ